MHPPNKIRTFYSNDPNYKFLKEAVNVLENAGMIIFPTDTVYAIGCLSNQSERLKDLAKIKGVKLEHAPLSFIFKDIKDLSEFVSPMNSKVFKLIKRILPGPYALIMKSAHKLPKPFQKRRAIGVRIPNHPILMKLLPLLSAPLVSTSILQVHVLRHVMKLWVFYSLKYNGKNLQALSVLNYVLLLLDFL